MTKWFGTSWLAPLCAPESRIDVPVGQPCFWCAELFVPGDRGVTIPHIDQTIAHMPSHLECHYRQIVGGLNHLQGQCTCCGGSAPPDPPGLTKREAAKAAFAFSGASGWI